ncbi:MULTISPECIES: FtsW/RodA/SpoVE family cell cycle protein [unclassified Carnobacterium]|uniref:FtsW/RodA/SpoVE family cell cycle protein n=1 Tax=unclassified Carnobacterium TaxID=257487 RepID=UPI0022A7DE10|nr:FtsW/RodA/SpoVE family cell cycle protein [Carnobacterium sp. CS13]
MLFIGALMVYSSSSDISLVYTGWNAAYFRNQLVYIFIGLIGLIVTFNLKISFLKNKKLLAFLLGLMFFLLVTVLFSEKVNGASRWIRVGSFNIQPVELTKLILLWYTAYILSRKQYFIEKNWIQGIWPPFVVLFLASLLILLQPDAGSIAIIGLVITIQVFSSGMPFRIGIMSSGAFIALIAVYTRAIYLFGDKVPGMSDYRLERFAAFWSPFELAEGAGLQLINSYYALSRGGLTGVGLGKSVQKTGYLPEPHTDFILSVIGEELGLLGVVFILSLLFFLITRIYYVGIKSTDTFSSLICIGVASLLLIQSAINIGGVVGWLPISGVTLPFMSYGGSSMIVLSICIGMVLNVQKKERKSS